MKVVNFKKEMKHYIATMMSYEQAYKGIYRIVRNEMHHVKMQLYWRAK